MQTIRADLQKREFVETEKMEWEQSPMQGVERKKLARQGDEVAIATSLVRYAAGSSFSSHRHDEGEEFLVLHGTFSDEYGDYPVGTYVRNPPHSSHAPFSREGCTILVKLRQMAKQETERVLVYPQPFEEWTSYAPGVQKRPLFASVTTKEHVHLLHLAQGAEIEWNVPQGGRELFVLEGLLEDEDGQYPQGTWLRDPAAGPRTLRCLETCTLWQKQGHLPSP